MQMQVGNHPGAFFSNEVSLDEARQYILHLDLTYIVEAMCAKSYPLPRWSQSDAQYCATLYKNFLFLQKKHLPEALVPTREIDEFWHNHILYTQHYFKDCANIFGHYLHHVPASPLDDPQGLLDGYMKTKQYYFAEFKKPLDNFK